MKDKPIKITAIRLPGVIHLDDILIEIDKIESYKEKLGRFFDAVKRDIKSGKIGEDFKFAIDPRNKDNWFILPLKNSSNQSTPKV